MSDYGALLEIRKIDNTVFESADLDLVNTKINQIKMDNSHLAFLTDEPIYKLTKTSDPKIIIIILSEYWYGEGDNEELFEFTYENDFDIIDEILDLFKNALSPNYLVKSNFCNW